MGKVFGGIFVAVIVVLLIIAVPLLALWALNVLAGGVIGYSFTKWVAVVVLLLFVTTSTTTKR